MDKVSPWLKVTPLFATCADWFNLPDPYTTGYEVKLTRQNMR